MLQHSQRLVERKNGIGHVRRWPAQASTTRIRSSSQDYPVFTPSYQEFANFPPESSDQSTDALVHENLLSSFTLDHTDIESLTVGSNYGRALDDKSTCSKASVYEALIQRRKIELKPQCIMAIHPDRGQVYNSQSMHGQISGEFLNDISSKCIETTQHALSDMQVSQRPATSDTSTVNKTVPVKQDGCNPSGCLACDKCLPGGRVTVVPLMDSRDYSQIPPRNRNLADVGEAKKTSSYSLMSWFWPKKKVSDMRESISLAIQASPKSIDECRIMHNTLCLLDKSGVDSNIKDMERTVNLLKLDVSQVTQRGDAALVEALELELALKKMEKKVDHLEEYCGSFNKLASEKPLSERISVVEICNLKGDVLPIAILPPWRVHHDGPTKKEFCNAITEARIGVKQFCRTLLQQIQEQSAVEKIESILLPYNVKVARVSKTVRYHIESLINQVFFEDFENMKFQKDGTTCILDPMQRPQAFYKAYLAISRMGWSELVAMDSVAYSEIFDGFCDLKMNRMQDLLKWDGMWPDELARAFFVTARWVWLLHLLAFSFEHPAMIFRVGPEECFDPSYMEELLLEQSSKLEQHGSGISAELNACVKAMVMPGFLFTCHEVIKCKVILSRVSVTPNTLSFTMR